MGAGGEGALQVSWESRPAPPPAPPQKQPHGAYHPAGVLHWHQVGGFSWVEPDSWQEPSPSEALWSGWGG